MKETEEHRKKLALRLACYLWHLSKSTGGNKITGDKEAIISAITDSFLSDENWPYPDTTVPPKDFRDE
jgi:hypothetical protein